MPGLMLLSLACIWFGRKLPAAEAALMVGISSMFLYALPANYYYVVFALFPVVVGSEKQGWPARALVTLFFVFWIFTWISYIMWRDDIVQFVAISYALGMLILAWCAVRFGEVIVRRL